MISRFYFDGPRLNSQDTPEEMRLRSGDCIEYLNIEDMEDPGNIF